MCAHGLVAMCALGCLDNDLTLLQAALQEIIKLLGKSMHRVCVLASFVQALHFGKVAMKSHFSCVRTHAHTHTHTHTHTDSGTDLCLHPSCITVLNTIAHTLRENPEVCHNSVCDSVT